MMYWLWLSNNGDPPTFSLTFTCADLRWEQLPYAFNKLNNLDLRDEDLKKLSYHKRHNLLSKNPILVAMHFQ